jgi:hypothetical protein
MVAARLVPDGFYWAKSSRYFEGRTTVVQVSTIFGKDPITGRLHCSVPTSMRCPPNSRLLGRWNLQSGLGSARPLNSLGYRLSDGPGGLTADTMRAQF